MIQLKRVKVETEQLRAFLQYDKKAYFALWLKDQGVGVDDIHDMHVAGITAITSGSDPKGKNIMQAYAWPRTFAKTTMLEACYPFKMSYHHNRNMFYVTRSSPNDKDAVAHIISQIQSDTFCAIYGEPVFTKEAPSEGEYKFRWCNKDIVLRARTIGKPIRGSNIGGYRPDFIGYDDIEKRGPDADTKEGYAGTKDWFYTDAVKSVAATGATQVYLGNLVQEPSILLDLEKDPRWVYTRYSAINPDGTALWPSRRPLSWLAADFAADASVGEAISWMGEVQNIPPSKINQVIDLKDVQLVQTLEPGDPRITLRCLTVDPAISPNSKADGAVCAVHGFVEGKWRLLDMVKMHGPTVYALADKIIDLCVKWNCGLAGVETVAYQLALLQVCQAEAANRFIDWIKFVPVLPGKLAKSVRIQTWFSMISTGNYLLPNKYLYLLTKAIEYRPSSNKKDDELDVCAYIVHMVQNYSEEMYGDLSRVPSSPRNGGSFTKHN